MTPLYSLFLSAAGTGATPAFISMPGWGEMLVIAFVGLLIFGRRLPEVGRSLGKTIVEFKRGIREASDQIDVSSSLDDRPKSALPPKREIPTPEDSTSATPGPKD